MDRPAKDVTATDALPIEPPDRNGPAHQGPAADPPTEVMSAVSGAASTEPLRETARAATFDSDAQAPLRGLASAGPDPERIPESTLRFAPEAPPAAQGTQRLALTPDEQESLRHAGAGPTESAHSAQLAGDGSDSLGGEPAGTPRPPAPRAPGERRPISRQSEEPKKGQEFRQVLQSPKARKIGIAVGAVLGIGLLGYVADLVMSSGEVPRGVVVAGVEIGGMDKSAADAKLRVELDGRAGRELPVTIGDVQTTLVPGTAGLSVDWDGTWDRIGGQPLNPVTRLTSLFGTETVEVDSAVDEQALGNTLEALRVHDRPTVEGTIVFENAEPVAVAPLPGRVLDVAAARGVLVDDWIAGAPMNLPVVPAPVAVRQDAIDQALHQIAQPAVAGPVTFDGKGGKAVLAPEQIATIMSFAPDGHGGLTPRIDQKVATDLLAPQLKESEVEPKDATFALTGSKPTVVPSVVGDKINWPKTLEPLSALLAASGPQRTAPAVYEKVEPKLTTAAADGLGIVEPMGEFTTSGFSGPSGVNIRTVARKVNGAVVKPGDTFSLNEFTGPRGTAEGYVESGIIDHGRPSKAVGGGISQFATTLYNAAYFAGLEDAGHTEHSYYISRYPAAREATVFDGAIDLSFRNNTPTGIYIEASANGSEVTVRIWGTKTVEVESITGDRTKPTEPKTITLPKGDGCIATEGADGFTVSDTRVITDVNTGKEVSRATRTVKYDPIPVVKCE
ncbi:VanW family protein [Nocardia cyriacigeorgica]|nr:VanW family protein [Nocardia cyriacigeorgica]